MGNLCTSVLEAGGGGAILSVLVPLSPPGRISLEILAHFQGRATEIETGILEPNSYGIKGATAEVARGGKKRQPIRGEKEREGRERRE
jgi:hypothetical protein